MAVLLALLSSAMWGTADFFGGLAARRWPSPQVVAISQAFGLTALLIVVLVTGEWRASADYWRWSIPAGLVSVIGLGAFYRALAIGPMAIVSPLASLGVVIPLGFSLVRGEVPTGVQLLGITAAIVGVVLAAGPEIRGARWPSLMLTIIAAAGFGLMVIFLAEGSKTSPLMTVTGMRAVTVVTLGVVLVVSRRTAPLDARGLGLTAGLGLLDAGANLLLAVATTVGMLATTSVLANLYPGVTALLAAWLLRERLMKLQYVGVAAVLVGVVLIASG